MRALVAFSGAGMVEAALKEIGVEVVMSIEWEPEIAKWARLNLGDIVKVADVRLVPVDDLPEFDYAHFSPVCTNVSQASQHKEADSDISVAKWIAMVITERRPQYVTIENVMPYRKTVSWRIIRQALEMAGYWGIYDDNFLASEYGVPQDRRRMIVRAKRDGFLPMPQKEAGGGWFAAVKDLVGHFEDDVFPEWQLKRFPLHPETNFLVMSGGNCNFGEAKPGKNFRAAELPATTVTTGSHPARTFLVSSANGGRANMTVVAGDEPSFTIVASAGKQPSRAFVVSGDSSFDGERLIVRGEDSPMWTVRANADTQHARCYTGQIKRLNMRALARIQSFPDWYKLPPDRERFTARDGKRRNLPATMIGNAVPMRMYELIAASMLGRQPRQR